jgi:hypothetical protein
MKPFFLLAGRWIFLTVRWWWRYGLALLGFCVSFIAIVPRSTVLVTDPLQAIAFDISPWHYDYVGWNLEAIAAKADQLLFGQQAWIHEQDQPQFVRDYMAMLSQVHGLEAQISALYTDPAVSDPETASADLRQQRDQQRATLAAQQSTAEAIVESQVARILVEQGFGVLGQLLPPISMRFTRMPNLLVTSPRDQIRMETSIALDPFSVDQQTALEAQLDVEHGISSLIIPLGGIALYPAMIQETASIAFTVETFAHEWLHHYLYFFPLGISYFTGDAFAGEARIINETTANLFGREIAALVLERYYPEIPPPPLPTYDPPVWQEPDPNAFDFGAEMNTTRVRVDELLAAGDVAGAEQYMEERRQFFYENGIRLRKINQAFFAFYGGYQAGGGVSGAGGQDPTGPAVLAIRRSAPGILDFILTLRSVTTRDELLRIAGMDAAQP